jgi:hypothetical protein
LTAHAEHGRQKSSGTENMQVHRSKIRETANCINCFYFVAFFNLSADRVMNKHIHFVATFKVRQQKANMDSGIVVSTMRTNPTRVVENLNI